MFDRIAGVYDLMNSVDDRRAAPPLARARRRPRARSARATDALDVCCGTGDLALELARRVGPGGRRRSARDFSEPMLDLARAQGRRARACRSRFEWADALELPYGDDELRRGHRRLRRPQPRRPRPRPARDGAGRCARAAAWWSSRSRTPHAAAAVDLLLALVRPRRAAARHARRRPRRLHLPARVGASASPARTSWPRAMDARRPRARSAGLLRRRDHRDPRRAHAGVTRPARRAAAPVTAVLDARRRPALPRAAWPRSRRASREIAAGARRRRSASDAGATLAAGGKRLRPLLVLLCAGRREARPTARDPRGAPRSSSSTWRRSSTTTCSTARRCAAAARRSSPAPGRDARDRDRRPAVLARLRRAGGRRRAPTRSRAAQRRLARRSPAASCSSAATPATPTIDARALPASAAS